MHKFEKFLFVYSIFAITIFFISFGIFSPRPLNFISGTLLLPILIYFWLRFTNPEGTSSDKWSVRFLISLALVSMLSIYGFYLAAQLNPTKYEDVLKSQLAEQSRLNEELNQRLATLSKTPSPTTKPENVKGESVTDIISEQVVKSGGTRISLKQNMESASIYLLKDRTSKQIDSIIPNVNYPFIEKSEGWYKIIASGNTTGWVNENDVDELK